MNMIPKKTSAIDQSDPRAPLITSPSNSPLKPVKRSPSKTGANNKNNSGNNTSVVDTTSLPPQNWSSSTLATLLHRKKKPAPIYRSGFSVPALPHLQKGGYYSSVETMKPVEGCPNVGNELHVCTEYCYNHYAPRTTKELLIHKTQQAATRSQACQITWMSAGCLEQRTSSERF